MESGAVGCQRYANMAFTSDVSMFAESNKAQIWLKALRFSV